MRPGIRLVRTAIAGGLLCALTIMPGRAATAGPMIWHTPVPYAGAGTAIGVTAQATCDAPCTARIFYRTTVAEAPADLFTRDDPTWASLTMGRDPGINLGTQTVFSFFVTLPGSVADSRGVDYIIKVIDGAAVSWSPGSPALLGGGLSSGYRSGAHHVFVAAPTSITHAPVATATYRTSIPIRVDANCPSACSGTLFFRRTGLLQPTFLGGDDPGSNPTDGADVQWNAISMNLTAVNNSFQQYGAGLYTFTAQIPSAYVDTRGVDYAVRVSDGRTKSYWPGTVYNGYAAPSDGTRFGWQHVHVVNPALAWHAQVQYSTTRATPLSLQFQALCWTEACSAQIRYHTFGGPIVIAAMSQTTVTFVGGAKLITYGYTVPASSVVAPTLSYVFRFTDGYTTAFSPGSAYNGYYVKLDGAQTGEYQVVVL